MGELKYFPSPSEGGVYAELLEAHSMVMTQGDATNDVEDLSVWMGAGVCSTELPLHWCPALWPSATGYPARERGYKWAGNVSVHSVSSHGKTHSVALPLSLEHSMAMSSQTEDRRTKEKEGERTKKKRKEKKVAPH